MILSAILSGSAFAQAAPLLKESKGLQLLEEIQNAISQLAEDVTPTVVGVSTIRQLSSPGSIPRQGRFKVPGSGSGVVIHEDGYIVTNNHVISNGVEAEVHFSDQSTLVAEIVAQDPDTDLALLKVETDRKLPSATFGDSSTVKVGQWVLAVGNPFGLDRTVTLGIVSGIGRENMNLSRYENFIQTDASINPGNSGGPLFNLRGEVIGINTAIINFAQGIGFAIPSNMASRIIEQLKTGGKVVRGWLGVGIQPLTPQLVEKFGIPDGKGILVNEVFADDPADQAGIQSGDIITRIGNERLESPNQLSRVVAGFSPGDEVLVHVIRDGTLLRLPVLLGVKKDKPIVGFIAPDRGGSRFGHRRVSHYRRVGQKVFPRTNDGHPGGSGCSGKCRVCGGITKRRHYPGSQSGRGADHEGISRNPRSDSSRRDDSPSDPSRVESVFCRVETLARAVTED